VIILDDLSTGKQENIAAVLKQDRVEFVEGNILNVPLLQKLTRGVEYVFHQAAIPSVSRSMDNPLASHEANVTGTLNVLITARDAGIKKVIYASSCAVYGDTPNLPIREDILNVTGSMVEADYEEPRSRDIRCSIADISKSKTFGYKPKYGLEEGLRQTFEKFGR